MKTSQLLAAVVLRLGMAFPVLGLFFFLPAGTLDYWQAWVYIFIIIVPMFFALYYLWNHNRALLERRLRMREKEAEQKRIIEISWVIFVFIYLLPGFDRRFGWSNVPAGVVLFADLCVLLGYLLVLWVFKVNSFASRIIEVEAGQKVISSGPYSLVRHPMYAGSLLMYILSPLALGSWWATLLSLALVWVLVARIRNEESVLLRELPGYADYTTKVRYRLIPGIW